MPSDTPPTTTRNPQSEQIPDRPLIRMKTPPRAVSKPVEKEDEEQTIQVPQTTVSEPIIRTKTSPVPEPSSPKPVPPQQAPDHSLKRPLEPEKKQESQPPVAAAPPKRRRMVNAAPDV